VIRGVDKNGKRTKVVGRAVRSEKKRQRHTFREMMELIGQFPPRDSGIRWPQRSWYRL
jgi:hypothetical protein